MRTLKRVLCLVALLVAAVLAVPQAAYSSPGAIGCTPPASAVERKAHVIHNAISCLVRSGYSLQPGQPGDGAALWRPRDKL